MVRGLGAWAWALTTLGKNLQVGGLAMVGESGVVVSKEREEEEARRKL